MRIVSSLSNRIFFASAALTVLAIAVAVYRVNVAVTAQAEKELQRGLREAGTHLEEYRTTLFGHFSRETRLVADLPKLKAALDTKDPATVQPLAEEYQRLIGSDLFLVTNPLGQVLAEAGRLRAPRDDAAAQQAIRQATEGREAVSLWHDRGSVIQVVSVPSVLGQVLGTVSVGFSLDAEAAQRFKTLTNSEIAFASGDTILASTLEPRFNEALARLAGSTEIQTVTLGNTEYVAVSRKLPLTASALPGAAGAGDSAGSPTALILRSRTEWLQTLKIVHTELALAAFLAVLAAIILSYAVARTITRPLGTITATMREMAATGDLTRRIALSPGRWEDEDARLLATTFNAMTDSIARFQREAAQRERLSSLGRLSTVVAHEIRNPLMIIKSALRSLKREPVEPEQVRAAAADIDEEIARLNHIVSEVLDFARPIKFDLAPVDLNGLCADAVKATGTDDRHATVRMELDPSVNSIVTDGERLRLALVNILTNARHAVAAHGEAAASSGAIRLATRRLAARQIGIEVADRGAGIAAEDLARIFDPFFTTRRTGTGLGLAITRNIIEGLGGSITVSSRAGDGTTVRIELPDARSEGRT
ncbi:MAG: hypothetical protein A3H96_15825 [Acidobacteria bacterium RIFCSPLOWO2_02_FULL_67_36]|nr:MAG: hypothetical protein A3H96_15825 [Acidobacteria bacterium RIFCSPLOWO2_02_FULL_67_36]OFW24145.1 MAG: hypothetical protein A3G21_20525 [Acidobacteria bacterium RIFCSPLOWO2_12_FULL_66_21]